MTNNPPILETSRLILNRMTVDDAENAYRLNLDPEVIQYTGDPPFTGIEDARNFLNAYSGYEQEGFGRFAVRLKDGGAFLGWCGLKYLVSSGETDLGFRLLKAHWNQGYATEASVACLRHGFNTLGLSRIIGRAMHANLASIRVLEKVGMIYWKDEICDEHPARIFKTEHHAFESDSL